PGGGIVGVVEDADVPWTSLFGLTLETRCKAVQRQDQRRRRCVEQRRERFMIGAMEARQAFFAPLDVEQVAGNRIPVTRVRDYRGSLLLAVEVAHQPADVAEKGGDAPGPGHA